MEMLGRPYRPPAISVRDPHSHYRWETCYVLSRIRPFPDSSVTPDDICTQSGHQIRPLITTRRCPLGSASVRRLSDHENSSAQVRRLPSFRRPLDGVSGPADPVTETSSDADCEKKDNYYRWPAVGSRLRCRRACELTAERRPTLQDRSPDAPGLTSYPGDDVWLISRGRYIYTEMPNRRLAGAFRNAIRLTIKTKVLRLTVVNAAINRPQWN